MPIDHTQNMVYAPHFYDLNVLFSKIHSWMSVNVQGLSRGMFVLRALYFGTNGLKDNYRRQIGNLIRHGKMSLDPKVPSIIPASPAVPPLGPPPLPGWFGSSSLGSMM